MDIRFIEARGGKMIVDELIKNFKDKNITVNKKRKDIFKQDCKEIYISRNKKTKNKCGGRK